ncbi:hypothetical protein [Nocardioides sp. Leaf285]|uniref:hypothetical protein n=1 Tax=Nocardioides sp. Leaf285 TaxID=1736322 RepID=UPI0007038DA4|nr:hypothetical protein [Nocardioides sp. Leaf285]KQP66775.1 hypothetical protein ASF47_03335 [Nocardioides sp. Leaf285]
MHPDELVAAARREHEGGASDSEIGLRLGVARTTVRDWRLGRWREDRHRRRDVDCPTCGEAPLAAEPYAVLLGYYLGDGCVSQQRRTVSLRVACDASLPGIVEDVATVVAQVRPRARVFRVSAPGTTVVHVNWRHWPCLFPQHGPGRKHERPIVLEAWQRKAVEAHPAAFLRGLFHSDGSRSANWTSRRLRDGTVRRYDYPRWQFVNASADIRGLCCWALDLVEVAWRQSAYRTISVSTRAGVARLDALVGLKG